MIDSRKIEDLHPKVQPYVYNFVEACRRAGITVLIYSTYRDNEKQNELYAQGRTKPGKIVTNARGGQSYHNWRCAFDFVPMRDGKPQWDDTTLYHRCGLLAESVGLEWAGRWQGKLREMAHCQYTGGLRIADLQAGRTIE